MWVSLDRTLCITYTSEIWLYCLQCAPDTFMMAWVVSNLYHPEPILMQVISHFKKNLTLLNIVDIDGKPQCQYRGTGIEFFRPYQKQYVTLSSS